MKPNNIFVVQSGDKNVEMISEYIVAWRKRHVQFSITHVKLGTNGRYHSRFFIAYMLSSSEYISVWDDDVIPGNEWLQYNIEVSKSHNDALVGGNCRNIKSIMNEEKSNEDKDNDNRSSQM